MMVPRFSNRPKFLIAILCVLILVFIWTLTQRSNVQASRVTPRKVSYGVASYYGKGFSGKLTASGERFNPAHLTAAHRTLPLGTVVRVTNLENDQSVVVEITDRGPYRYGRVIDLSARAARNIGIIKDGLTKVRIEVIPD